MMTRSAIQVIAFITATIGLLLSVIYSGNADVALALKVYSYGTSVSVLVFLAYDKFIWHWRIVRFFTKRPDLRGTWKGELRSSFERDGQRIDPIPTILRIKQTATTQSVTLFTGESSSVTEQSQLVREADDRWRFTWTYLNTPRSSVRHRSDCHMGTAEVTFDPIDGLVGSYYTDRQTRGELNFGTFSKKLFASVSAAEADVQQFKRLK